MRKAPEGSLPLLVQLLLLLLSAAVCCCLCGGADAGVDSMYVVGDNGLIG